jgi:hypothetical protein
MDSRVECVKALFAALQQNDMELAANLLDDRFTLVGLTSSALDKAQFLGLHSELLDAMPDFSYHMKGAHWHEDLYCVEATIQITGTHSEELSLPQFGLPSLPATGVAAELPLTPIIVEVENDHVTRLEVAVFAGGGLSGLLQQVAPELPLLPRTDRLAE